MAFPKKIYGDDEARWDASVRRDPRAVGHFLIGVRTTRIYCLPTCPARPKRENVFFVQTPEEAVAAGCRPCLLCKPPAA
jgi:AraC family transcriptional regulator of adaptative response / DNA-3-methyladenine glycosylase II